LRRRRVLDHPNQRSSHQVAVPRGAGVAPAIGVLTGLAVTSGLSGTTRLAVAGTAVGFAAIGLADDVRGGRGVPPFTRLALQLAVSAVAAAWLGPIVALPVVALWLAAYVNAYNFMDGINGIAIGQAVVAGVAWLLIGEARHVPAVADGGALVAAAGFGFLPLNFPTARAFLGDVGSYFLGGWLAATATTLAWRVAGGQRWYEAHRDHAYQRLVRGGWSHTGTTAAATAVMASCALLGAVSLSGSLVARAAADATLLAVLAGYVAAPALVAA
jgi:UDP-N-acetylmuramyl pentapeptide phosphotransferase/UDP-N-acetylglucosamine-1-phosphate transferase